MRHQVPMPKALKPVTPAQMRIDAASLIGGRQDLQAVKWGTQIDLAPPWSNGEVRVIADLDLTPLRSVRPPRTQALIVSARLPDAVAIFYATRWVIEVGAGGGRTVFEIDGGGVQQITVPAEAVRISYKLERWGPLTYTSPTGVIPVAVFFSDGTTATSPPTFTDIFQIANGTTQTFRAPAGATTFRISGAPGAAGPYQATNTFIVRGPGTINIDSYDGAFLQPIRFERLPFNGQAIDLFIQNGGAVQTSGFIEWGIDL